MKRRLLCKRPPQQRGLQQDLPQQRERKGRDPMADLLGTVKGASTAKNPPEKQKGFFSRHALQSNHADVS
eukprot:9325206-Pyramimonas_sp.AAC.1